MSNGDIFTINDETIADSEKYISDKEVYKNLRRHSASLTFIFTLFLPLLLFYFNISCTPRRTMGESFQYIYDMLVFDFDCLAIVFGWLLVQLIFCLPIKNRSYQKSDITSSVSNGLIAFVFSLGGISILNWLNIIHASYIYDNINKILIASIIVSYFISVLLYIKGSRTRYLKEINPIVGFFYGTDINLTMNGINLKLFFELRAGLIGWACLNLCFFLKTMELYTYRRPPAFILVVIQQILQVLQLIWYEKDRIKHNHIQKQTIGFIHVFGSLCWFPFLWCLPSQYLILVNYPIKRIYIITSVGLFIIGMFIYRSAHNQEEILKKSCQKNIKPILFKSLTFLYRHPYYLGNLLMFISWSIPCGLMSIPWILPIYYLLVIYYQRSSL